MRKKLLGLSEIVALIAILGATVYANAVVFTDVIKKGPQSKKYCPDSIDGQTCFMTEQAAERYCKDRNMELPSTRQWGEFIAKYHATPGMIETSDREKVIGGKAPDGYYRVDSLNENGKFDTLFFSNANYSMPPGEWKDLLFWTSSVVPFCKQADSTVRVCGADEYANAKHNTIAREDSAYAHVFYGSIGGGGGKREEHQRTHPNAVRCVVKTREPFPK